MVQRLRTAYVASGVSIGKLAQELGGVLTAQGITEIFGERANPTSEQTLSILEFLKDDTMRTLIDPPASRPTTSDPGRSPRPRTLSAAIDALDEANATISNLRSELAQAKAAAVASPAKTVSVALAATTRPNLSVDAPRTTNTPDRKMPVGTPAPPLKMLPPDADCPSRIQKYLDAMTESQVRDCLRGEHDPLRLGMTYKELQKRKALTAVG